MVQDFFRKDLSDFESYSAGKTDYKVRLNANESFSNLDFETRKEIGTVIENSIYNRYPDPDALEVCDLYAKYANVLSINVMAGNGSDECIQIIAHTFLNAGDKVAMQSPDFSMYGLYTKVAGGIPIEFPLGPALELDVDGFISMANNEKVKIVFLSNPNNPTGNIIKREDIIKIIEGCKCIVVIDEAYFEFYGESILDKIDFYENVIVLRTCSKIGLAAIRLGFMITNKILMAELKKVKPPYNVNSITQGISCVILKKTEIIYNNVKNIIAERDYLWEKLSDINGIKLYKAKANFILVEVPNALELKAKLLKQSINVRSFTSGKLVNCLRITIGSREENNCLLKNII
ncbi:histidinol-phosphate transaminase [Clostridium estertheticum]|uniref:Histidinol-phosphate aminotransferase n=1 Tax=Clostridium estertheticum TaxID=238834 RepID=A0A7Y3SXM3_9CLOT|nr:histidinol-phosphate transaminase [Clostridium estertheticum]NNU77261.1 histidinol-phosphate transaminase [Clostridium estertheticum]WBL45696.1 histidinol-phosphate transaminase [Clostridium estertheticum]